MPGSPAPSAVLNTQEAIDYVRKTYGNKMLVGFSRGKDSIALALRLIELGFDVELFHCGFFVPLEFIENSLQYFESKFNLKIHRLVHAKYYIMLEGFEFQPPERAAEVERLGFIPYKSSDGVNHLRKKTGIIPCAYGYRKSDTMCRRLMLTRSGSWNEKDKIIYPIAEMTINDVYTIIKKHNIKLPFGYEMFGRSFDGIWIKYLKPIKKYFPEDYKRILDFFPLADIQFLRQEMIEHGR